MGRTSTLSTESSEDAKRHPSQPAIHCSDMDRVIISLSAATRKYPSHRSGITSHHCAPNCQKSHVTSLLSTSHPPISASLALIIILSHPHAIYTRNTQKGRQQEEQSHTCYCRVPSKNSFSTPAIAPRWAGSKKNNCEEAGPPTARPDREQSIDASGESGRLEGQPGKDIYKIKERPLQESVGYWERCTDAKKKQDTETRDRDVKATVIVMREKEDPHPAPEPFG